MSGSLHRKHVFSVSSPSSLDKEKKIFDEEASLSDEEFRLPINHRIEENLDRENLEQASLDKCISSNNIGYKLLQKMGWKGKGLGKNEQGIVEPVRSELKDAKLGVGKQEEDDFYTSEENVQRRKLEIEIEETEEIARKREAEAERELKVKSEVKEIMKTFYCQLCNKQYKIAMEYEAHLSSYDHNHRKRFKEMKALQNGDGKEERMKREQIRAERELAKMASKMEAQKQQKQEEFSVKSPPSTTKENSGPKAQPAQSGQVKFGFGGNKSVGPAGKLIVGFGKKPAPKKPKTGRNVGNVFGFDED